MADFSKFAQFVKEIQDNPYEGIFDFIEMKPDEGEQRKS